MFKNRKSEKWRKKQAIYYQVVKTPNKLCLVETLKELAADPVAEGADRHMILDACNNRGNWKYVPGQNIRVTVHWVAVKANLHLQGFLPKRLESHSFRVRGTIGLKLNSHDPLIIKNAGVYQVGLI